VYEANAQIPSPAPPAPKLKVGKDDFSTLWRAAATVTGKAPVTVSFAVKRKPRTGWQLLAADDTPPSVPSSTGASREEAKGLPGRDRTQPRRTDLSLEGRRPGSASALAAQRGEHRLLVSVAQGVEQRPTS
jgi:hypothetical protein